MSRSIGFQDTRYVTSPEQNFQGRVGILENFLLRNRPGSLHSFSFVI
jgi:hypothetical protein